MSYKKEKQALKKYLNPIISTICSFVNEVESEHLVGMSNSIPNLLDNISIKLKEKELLGWRGEDLNEDQLNVLTLISEIYSKRNKSKYKVIELPSEIIQWFKIYLIEFFTKSELALKNFKHSYLQ